MSVCEDVVGSGLEQAGDGRVAGTSPRLAASDLALRVRAGAAHVHDRNRVVRMLDNANSRAGGNLGTPWGFRTSCPPAARRFGVVVGAQKGLNHHAIRERRGPATPIAQCLLFSQ